MKEDRNHASINSLEEISGNLSVNYQAEGVKGYKRILPYYCVLVLFIVMLTLNAVKVTSSSMKQTYDTVKEDNIQSVYNSIYENRFNAAESKAHVSNDIAIRLEDIQEMANLEVLRVNDVEYIVTNNEDNPDKITSWIEVPGTGVFTVDLSCGEFIVDSLHHNVHICVQQPRLSNFKVDNDNMRQLLWKDDVFDGSVKVGEDEMRDQISEGAMRLKEYFTSNRMIHESAVNSAKNMIESLVKQLNPEISDLVVEVEFIEDV